MNDFGQTALLFFLLYVGLIIAAIAIMVIIIRWVFRINVIVDLLQKIAASHKCHSCDRFFRVDELEKIESGQLLCSHCLSTLKSPQPESPQPESPPEKPKDIIQIKCPFCKNSVNAPVFYLNKKVKCLKCKNSFVVSADQLKEAVN